MLGGGVLVFFLVSRVSVVEGVSSDFWLFVFLCCFLFNTCCTNCDSSSCFYIKSAVDVVFILVVVSSNLISFCFIIYVGVNFGFIAFFCFIAYFGFILFFLPDAPSTARLTAAAVLQSGTQDTLFGGSSARLK